VTEAFTLDPFQKQAVAAIDRGESVLVAVITPSGDPISLAALSVPMYLFYEISILIGRVITRRRQARVET
jgi:sec-independent protein translocase protein TatC